MQTRTPNIAHGVAAAAVFRTGADIGGSGCTARGGHGFRDCIQVVPEADAPRVNCPAYGPTVVAVPWARSSAGRTLAFDNTVSLAGGGILENRGVQVLMQIAWRTVRAIVARFCGEHRKARQPVPEFAANRYRWGRFLQSAAATT